ncbi:MAG TPA: glycosyl hydrolase family 39 [Edaphobacter sp.]|jgi:xylan 1,4-beta-xylosidase|nr:glycosyl hydrolase family 39 [Edaphobacter sp.]
MLKISGRLCFTALLLGFTAWLLGTILPPALHGQSPSESQPASITINTRDPGTPFPHFWEQIFGSGRAILSLRQSYRDDLHTVTAVTDFDAVRFHGIFMDDVGLYDPNATTQNPGQAVQKAQPGQSPYNFSYIDQIYDGLLANHIRPFVELSFMPKKMASDPNALHAFWYKQNVSPPKDYALWDAMITAFTQHLIDRYGIDEVSKWRFEVWNEPNIDFWVGNPKQPTYFDLYDHTALAIKKVSNRLLIGGPSTAQAAWVAAFLDHCKQKSVPVDFVTTHVYANDTAKDVFGTDEQIPRDKMVCRAVSKVHDEIAASPFPNTPLIFSEYNASYSNEPNVTDTIYMGPWLAGTISQCDGLTEAMSYWSFSDVFEEQGVIKTPFYGGFGLVAEDGIPKPALNAFAMLHQLGDRRIKVDSDSALATRRSDGAIAIALWNYAPPFGTGASYTPPPANTGPSKTFTVKLTGVSPNASVQIWRLDADHGNVIKTYDAMGRPAFPTRDQIALLRAAGKPFPPQNLTLTNGALTITVPPQGLVLIKLSARTAAH